MQVSTCSILKKIPLFRTHRFTEAAKILLEAKAAIHPYDTVELLITLLLDDELPKDPHETVRMMIEIKVDISATDADGNDALLLAAAGGYTKTMDSLLMTGKNRFEETVSTKQWRVVMQRH